MTGRRALAFAAILTVVLVVPTGGVDTTAADRGVGVTVVSDDRAYLGVAQSTETTNDTTNLTVTVTNRFAERLSTVEITASGSTAEVGPLAPGDAGEAVFRDVACTEFRVRASGDSVAVALSRPVAC